MYIEANNVINQDQYNTIKQFSICGICKGILYEPYQCQKCENGFCKKCLETWEKQSKTCPYKCAIPYEDLFHHYDYSCSKIKYEEKVKPLMKKLNELELVEKDALLVNEKLEEAIEKKDNLSINYKEMMTKHPRYKQGPQSIYNNYNDSYSYEEENY